MNDVWAIVLAAGMSTRMGTQKLMLPFEGKTIVEKVVENIFNSGIGNVMVVLGANHVELTDVLKPWPIKTIWNENFREGMHSSLISGVNALPATAKGSMIFLGDQPFIPEHVSMKVIKAWKDSGKGIVIPLFNGKRGHPPLYDMKYRNELINLDPQVGLRSVAIKFQEDICEVETFCPEIVRDIDTRDEYLRELGKVN